MTTSGRLHQILERLRVGKYGALRPEFVSQVADIEERNVFDDDRSQAQRELRQLIDIEIVSAHLEGEGQ